VFPPISKFEEIDITKALTSRGRLHYPKIAKKSRLDEFLARRTHLKVLEERKFAQNVCSFNVLYYVKYKVCLKRSLAWFFLIF
jgi:nucleosome-remodeling factor subunit BPTF